MQAAIATSSVRPYMWIVSGPMSSVPVCGEGMDARLTRATFCPRGPRPAPVRRDRRGVAPRRLSRRSVEPDLNQDVDRRVVRAPLLDQRNRHVQVDVVPRRECDGVTGVVARADELFGAPLLDALLLGLADDVYFRSSHAFGIRSERASGSPPAGGSQRIRRASSSACAFVNGPSSRSVTSPSSQRRTFPCSRTGAWRN